MAFQSTLGGEDDGIAEELAASQRQISIAEFFEKNKHMLGFDSEARSIITAVKEGVDNALDATEEAGILPDINVEIHNDGNYYTLIIEDNGPGLPKSNIPKVFGKLLYGSRFGSMTQSRGQQGIGISAAVLYSQLTSGKPARITSRPKGSDDAYYVELTLNTDTNEPEIQSSTTVEWEKDHGTRIELEMEANMRARSRLYDYIRATAVVNPHARITFDEPNRDEPLVSERATDELPQQPEEILPHPHGVELGHVIKMLDKTDSNTLSGFLQSEFTKVGRKSAETILNHFRDDWFGRELAVDVAYYNDADEDDVPGLTSVITDAVSNKSADSKETFADTIVDELEDADRVSYCDIKRIVNEVAETVEDGFAITYGSTVRENVIDALWNALRPVADCDIRAVVDEATTDRKDDDAIATVADVIYDELDSRDQYRATLNELESFVDAGAERAEDQQGETFGDTSREKITDALWERMHTVSDDVPLVREAVDDRDIVSALITGMQRTSVNRPSTKCLSPISPEKLEAGLRTEYDAEFYSSSIRDAGVHSGHPFIVEAGLAYGGDIEAEGNIELLRFANRVPLVYQPGACALTTTVGNIGWRNYKLTQKGGSGLPDGPVVLMVHVASTNVPFTSESKDALADVPDIEYEIEQAVREAARDLKSYLKKQKSLKKRKRKQNVIADLLPKMAEKAADVSGSDEEADVTQSLARIMNSVLFRPKDEELAIENFSNGRESFTLRLHFEDEKPTYPSDNLTRVETDDGWALVWEDGLDDEETTSLTWNASESPDIEPVDIADEKVSYTNTDFN